MSGKKGHGGGGGGGGHDAGGGLRWLLTYADMITLLLALFIYLYSISSVSEAKLAAFTEAFSQRFGFGSIPIPNSSTGAVPVPGSRSGESKARSREPASGDGKKPGYKEAQEKQAREAAKRNLEVLKRQLEREFPDWLKQGALTMLEVDEGLMLRLRDNALFEKGSADITANAQVTLAALADHLKSLQYPLRIEGHTDDLPLAKGAHFVDNWELSTARAGSVLRSFDKQGIPAARMSLAGYGEYKPIEANLPGKGNPANRRVEILIVAPFGTPENGAETRASETAPTEAAPASAEATVPAGRPGSTDTPPLVFSGEPQVVPGESTPAPRTPVPPPPRSAPIH